MGEKESAPLYEALVAHAERRARSYHVPGHKQRARWDEGLGAMEAVAYYDRLLALDVTELSDTDDLHHPEGPIAQAQAQAAECFGAEETRLLVGGSTAGNLAMIIGICQPGDLVIVQRNVHKSIIHGLMLAGARAVLLQPEIDPLSGLATLPGARQLLEAIEKYREEAKAVILSAPNYYGMAPDLKPLIAHAHWHGIPVLVDEAHGPHFGFHPAFPESALQAGADLVVQSTHKMLSSMTMGAMLHMQGDRLPRQAIRQALTMVQSSSPSFPIMASLDLARRQVHTLGEGAFHEGLEAAKIAAEGLHKTSFRAIGYGEYATEGMGYDPFKLVLFDEKARLSGFELRDELERRKCVAEMADARYVVMAFGTGSEPADGRMLIEALAQIENSLETRIFAELSVRRRAKEHEALDGNVGIRIPEPVSFGREVYAAKAIPFNESAGHIAAEWVIPYPPGIPVLYPGETITEETVRQLRQWKHQGAQIQGASDSELNTIQVRESTN
ncbi:aminotransferase class I/II-fold pyridoxal phosphate-dependent enzyme [Cohnella endophytica]|uniref:Aminotransferase class I/II-fold pyridoxal phosphate-dependent enzyme n=1 Tax=Cohnella endophytica TaxID=2419778 RepID=A0A494X560_9BACL|nr:aminotransferase class I/II-fold pyridoxal phosphate-dependent enzyme [Cohnella endophytica]RKP45472.1 aminotransferase class I/II-fold pyridoxal phosphate-dependent enzyme [Cohnella endophytica]